MFTLKSGKIIDLNKVSYLMEDSCSPSFGYAIVDGIMVHLNPQEFKEIKALLELGVTHTSISIRERIVSILRDAAAGNDGHHDFIEPVIKKIRELITR